jgi:O-succinylhomoserine sulfhydrylase
MAQQSGKGGAVVSFELRSDSAPQARERAFKLLDTTQTISLCTNLGDVKSLLSHPASTSHGRLSEDQRQSAGIGQGLVRLAVGLEHVGDLQADLERSFAAL